MVSNIFLRKIYRGVFNKISILEEKLGDIIIYYILMMSE